MKYLYLSGKYPVASASLKIWHSLRISLDKALNNAYVYGVCFWCCVWYLSLERGLSSIGVFVVVIFSDNLSFSVVIESVTFVS